MSTEKRADAFRKASKLLREEFSLDAITRKWNKSGLGRPARPTTVKRWLGEGPETKNPRFETWVVGLASFRS